MDSLAAAPHAADLDGSGDLDLLGGNIAGRVIWIPNTGSARAPKFENEGRKAIFAEVDRIQAELAPPEAGADYHGYAGYLRRIPPKDALPRN